MHMAPSKRMSWNDNLKLPELDAKQVAFGAACGLGLALAYRRFFAYKPAKVWQADPAMGGKFAS